MTDDTLQQMGQCPGCKLTPEHGIDTLEKLLTGELDVGEWLCSEHLEAWNRENLEWLAERGYDVPVHVESATDA